MIRLIRTKQYGMEVYMTLYRDFNGAWVSSVYLSRGCAIAAITRYLNQYHTGTIRSL